MSNPDRPMTIGAVAALTGRRPSSIRYYEQIGLLPPARRVNGRRVYGPDTVRTLAVIETGQRAGLTLDEIGALLSASPGDRDAIERLRDLAARKLPQISALITRTEVVRGWLESAVRCECPSLDQCPLFDEPVLPETPGPGMHPAAEALAAALRVQVRTGRLIRAVDLSLESPCPGWSVRDVMNHSIGVTLKFAGFAAGGGGHPRSPSGDLVGHDHRLALRSAAAAAQEAWASADMARPCHLPFGTYPASVAAGINLFDVLAHTWDIATAAGVTLECADELWIAGLEAARTVIGPERDPRQYGAEVPVPAAAAARQRFLAFTGRRN